MFNIYTTIQSAGENRPTSADCNSWPTESVDSGLYSAAYSANYNADLAKVDVWVRALRLLYNDILYNDIHYKAVMLGYLATRER